MTVVVMSQDPVLAGLQQEAAQRQQPGLAATWTSCRSALISSRAAEQALIVPACMHVDGEEKIIENACMGGSFPCGLEVPGHTFSNGRVSEQYRRISQGGHGHDALSYG